MCFLTNSPYHVRADRRRAVKHRDVILRPGDSAEAAGPDDGGDPVKTVTVRDLQKKVKQCVDDAQEDRVVVTRRGKPAAVLVGVEGADWDAVVLQTDPAFWKMVRARRKQKTLSLDQLRARLRAHR